MEFIYKRAWDYPKAWENEMNIRELEQIINDCKIKIVEAETAIKDLQEKKSVERWRADNGSSYYYINLTGDVQEYGDKRQCIDNFLYDTGNYFKTIQEAENHKRRLLIEQKIKDIAFRLNDGKEIDRNDTFQAKFYITYKVKEKEFVSLDHYRFIDNVVYCLSDKFLETVLDEVGEEDLKYYYGVE